MKLLALDTSMQACSAAVLVKEDGAKEGGACKVHGLREHRERGHAERLMPMIDEVLALAGLGVRDLDRLAVTTGPGTFTGVRIGVAAARGLALALGLPLVAQNSLRVIAAQAFESWAPPPERAPKRLVGVVLDARRDQLYFQLFDQEGAYKNSAPQVIFPQQAEKILPTDKTVCLIGSGRELLRQHISENHSKNIVLSDFGEGTPQPDAACLARLAHDTIPTDQPVAPLYLRPPDAKIQSGYAIERK
ncbi:MAG: tRNA (adenosine(37)-N6)-threonylcarbamoyltransferase complex dimerization subunit type 1 TsaB [Hyphomicrobiaceae bacterium]|nr:tRNA (adenosine(37)-N6)-threonylcarbamoyltransferase complex dimerization subunit type 1 TsaB [Hyphomicrobiaceae bacterium]